MKTIYLTIILSCGALGAALYAQYFLGYKPCILCLYQQRLYGFICLMGFVGLSVKSRCRHGLYVLLIMGCAAQCALALYHWGIQEQWWSMFGSCKVETIPSLDDLEKGLVSSTCTEKNWLVLTLPISFYNMLLSGLLTIKLIHSWRRHFIKP
jgi:disulfide bond formation protein DsbB